MKNYNINSFFCGMKSKVLFSFQEHNFDKTQKSLLEETFNNYIQKTSVNPVSNPLSVFYFIADSWKKELDEKAELLGSFCILYVLSLDLFDDVQDEDLEGKPYEKVGAAIAINTAITLLFLSLELLRKAIELETDTKKKIKYLKVFNRVSLLAVKGQHKDLMGVDGAKTPEEVLDMQKAKTSSISLIAECAAIFSGCNDENILKYRHVSEKMVLAVQIVDDIRDIYGKEVSPDLITNKMTYPIACFLEIANAEQINTYNQLKNNISNSMKEIRELLYNSGAIEKSAEKLESLRINIHQELASINISSPSTRTWLYIIDSLVNAIYSIPLLEESKFISQPDGEWHNHIRKLADDFSINMKEFNPPEIPPLLPWHLPQWMYSPNRNVIFYADIEGQPEEILPLQSELLGISDLNFVKEIITKQSLLVMAHEFFHYWRDTSENLTEDFWYEEWVANTLATAYIKTFFPDLGQKTKLLADQILDLKNTSLSPKGQEILNKFSNPNYKASSKPLGYEVNLDEMTFIQISMLRKLYDQNISLDEAVKKLLC